MKFHVRHVKQLCIADVNLFYSLCARHHVKLFYRRLTCFSNLLQLKFSITHIFSTTQTLTNSLSIFIPTHLHTQMHGLSFLYYHSLSLYLSFLPLPRHTLTPSFIKLLFHSAFCIPSIHQLKRSHKHRLSPYYFLTPHTQPPHILPVFHTLTCTHLFSS